MRCKIHLLLVPLSTDLKGGGGGGGVKGTFFGRINFVLWAPQVPLVMRETFGEVPGLRRPIGSGPRPAQIWEPEMVAQIATAEIARECLN